MWDFLRESLWRTVDHKIRLSRNSGCMMCCGSTGATAVSGMMSAHDGNMMRQRLVFIPMYASPTESWV